MSDKDWFTSGEWEKVFSVDFQIGDEIRSVDFQIGDEIRRKRSWSSCGWDYKVIGFNSPYVIVEGPTGRVDHFVVPNAWGDDRERTPKGDRHYWYRRVTIKPYDPSQQKDEEDDI